MKLLSSFDTEQERQVVQECVNEYWADKVFVIHRDHIFFLFHVILPWIFFLLLMIMWIGLGFVVAWFLEGEFELTILWIFFIWSFIIALFMVSWKLLKLFIDYKMDFTVVNPEKIISYNQTWLFTRSSRSIDTNKIKTISVDKNWILKSLFNYWTIVILTEWDVKTWDIKLFYVYNPDIIQKRIWELTDFGEDNQAKAVINWL